MKTTSFLAILMLLATPAFGHETKTVVIDLGIVTAAANTVTEFNRTADLPPNAKRWIGWKAHWTRNSNPNSSMEVSATAENGDILGFHAFDNKSPISSNLESFPGAGYRNNPLFLHFQIVSPDIPTQARLILQLFAR